MNVIIIKLYGDLGEKEVRDSDTKNVSGSWQFSISS